MAGYVTAVPAFVCSNLPALEASNFGIFEKLFSDLWFFLRLLFKMCLIRSIIIANLCPIMIPFISLGFSECRFREVIDVFCRSVYIDIYNGTSWTRTS